MLYSPPFPPSPLFRQLSPPQPQQLQWCALLPLQDVWWRPRPHLQEHPGWWNLPLPTRHHPAEGGVCQESAKVSRERDNLSRYSGVSMPKERKQIGFFLSILQCIIFLFSPGLYFSFFCPEVCIFPLHIMGFFFLILYWSDFPHSLHVSTVCLKY